MKIDYNKILSAFAASVRMDYCIHNSNNIKNQSNEQVKTEEWHSGDLLEASKGVPKWHKGDFHEFPEKNWLELQLQKHGLHQDKGVY
ncbi:hypothetical protein HUJ05_012432 [Dendroctonus ponderosae]|nr:hypothetical protein HUJ05_012432 [Dendroctonus ponderosae]